MERLDQKMKELSGRAGEPSQLRKGPPWLPLPAANHRDTWYTGGSGKPAVENVRGRQCERKTKGPGSPGSSSWPPAAQATLKRFPRLIHKTRMGLYQSTLETALLPRDSQEKLRKMETSLFTED